MYTIVAIATPHAAGGISVIRISGDSAVSVAQTCFRSVTGKSLSEMPGYTCAYGKFCDPSGAELDDGIATVFRAPHSYTGEDTVEFSCHGGIFVTQQLLESVYAAGAVPAEPGEFTKRAFLAGKMTLTQAEAVMDVIGAAGKRELSFAHAQQNIFRILECNGCIVVEAFIQPSRLIGWVGAEEFFSIEILWQKTLCLGNI